MTVTVEVDKIEIRKRQRKEISTPQLNELKESILTTGLLHPPVCWFDSTTQTWVLTAGERRMTAIRKIFEEKKSFRYSGEIFFQCVPVTQLGDYLDSVGRFEAELAENVFRVDLDWPDRMKAFADLHALRQLQNPKQTKEDTGHELINRGVFKTPSDGTAGSAARTISQAVIIAEHLDNEKVANARNPAEALQTIYRMQEEKALAALARRGLAVATTPAALEIRQGDLLDVLPTLDPGTFDLICADPPYGIGASGAGFRARSVVHHNYTDDVDTAKSIARCIITEGFRVTKPRANIFVFCDIELFDWLKALSSNMGWVPFKRPLIWQKSESEGLAPWGGSGPRITTEFIFYATKGQRGMNASPTDVFNIKRVPRHERIHAAEKPVELLSALIQCASLPGERILDPCCGSGSTLVAAKSLNRTGVGIEKDPDYYNTALANLHGKL
jgi:site-specific DNA-methyltransferase (adenine-specific)